MTDYKSYSTIALIRKIVFDSDQLALRVFHETRTLFYRNGRWVRLAEFIRDLKDNRFRDIKKDGTIQTYMSEISDDAYDLTLAKFRNIPSLTHRLAREDESATDNDGFTWNVDCRLYFKSLLEEIETALSKEDIQSEIYIETVVAGVATTFVKRQFHRSMKECTRRNSGSIQYAWHVGGRVIRLFYPPHLTAKQFLNWLEENFKDVNPDVPYEKERIQEIIDQKLSPGSNIQVDDPEIAEKLGRKDRDCVEDKEGKQFCDNLSSYIAEEKSDNLEKLRPAIEKLGKEGVYDLVKKIFADLGDDTYNLSETARNFNLSKAALSRFAGSDWLKDEDLDQLTEANIPDLWINTTRILAENPILMETVKNTGFGYVIDDVLRIIGPKEGQKNEGQ